MSFYKGTHTLDKVMTSVCCHVIIQSHARLRKSYDLCLVSCHYAQPRALPQTHDPGQTPRIRQVDVHRTGSVAIGGYTIFSKLRVALYCCLHVFVCTCVCVRLRALARVCVCARPRARRYACVSELVQTRVRSCKRSNVHTRACVKHFLVPPRCSPVHGVHPVHGDQSGRAQT